MDVSAGQIREVGDQLVDPGPRGERIEHVDHAHPGARDDRAAAADFGIDDDALAHRVRMLEAGGIVKQDPSTTFGGPPPRASSGRI